MSRTRRTVPSYAVATATRPLTHSPYGPTIDEATLLSGRPDRAEAGLSYEEQLDLPPDAHILVGGRDSWSSVLFPVFCVAEDDDEIVPLIASAAYQRCAWGTDLPSVGFTISRYGSRLLTYIAWVEISTGPGPKVSISYCKEGNEANEITVSMY